KDAQKWQVPLLIGLNVVVFDTPHTEHRFNSALLFDEKAQVRGRYHKIHRVPFGEYLPFRESFPWMDRFSPYQDFDYSIRAGTDFTRFSLGNYRFSVVICYEDTDPDLTRRFVSSDEGPSANFLVNISNDGWFDGTSEHEEHLAVSRFRAIECRRSLVR